MNAEGIFIEPIAGPYTLAEGPHWDEQNHLLYFVDIPNNNIYCWHPETKRITHTHLPDSVSVVIPVVGKPNTFIAGSGTKLVEVSWDPNYDNLNPSVKTISIVDGNPKTIRFNDGKVDPKGRLWAGTMGVENGVIKNDMGSLYRFSYDGTPTKLLSPVSISNGLVWSPNNDTFYYIDSPTKQIAAYNYNDTTGDISNKHIVFDLTKNNIPGVPDGMTIDKNGNLWVAVFDGARVIEVNPKSGELLRTIDFHESEITSVAFGGSKLDILYVTTGRENLSKKQLEKQPLAGHVFAVHGLLDTGAQMLSCKIN